MVKKHKEVKVGDKLYGIRFKDGERHPCPGWVERMAKHVGELMTVTEVHERQVRLNGEYGSWTYNTSLLLEKQPNTQALSEVVKPQVSSVKGEVIWRAKEIEDQQMTPETIFPVVNLTEVNQSVLVGQLELFIRKQREDRNSVLYICDYIHEDYAKLIDDAMSDVPKEWVKHFGVIGWLGYKVGHNGDWLLHDIVSTILNGVEYSRKGVDALNEEQFAADYRIEFAKQMIAIVSGVPVPKPEFAINIFRNKEKTVEIAVQDQNETQVASKTLMNIEQLRDCALGINDKLNVLKNQADELIVERKDVIEILADKGIALIEQASFPFANGFAANTPNTPNAATNSSEIKRGDVVRLLVSNSDGFTKGCLAIVRTTDNSSRPYYLMTVDSDGDSQTRWVSASEVEFVAR